MAVQGFAEERNLRFKETRFATEEPVYTLSSPASYTERLNKEALRTLDMVVEHMKIVVRDLLEKDAGCGRGAGPEELFL